MKFDVLVLFHLCGDLMQPLHVGYGSDKGGNTYQVNYNGKGTNLHAFWDSRIIDKEGITLADLKDVAGLKYKRINFMESLAESRALLPQVYALQGHKFDVSYLQKNRPVVIAQVKYVGNLLASILDHLPKKLFDVPLAPASPLPSASQKPATAGKTLVPSGTITLNQAAVHIGETVTVCGKVYGTRALNNGPTILNMGGEYPNNPFTAMIMFDKRSSFSYKPEEFLKGKTICVTGTVKNYKRKPEIVVEKEEQIKVQ